jgi:hypothetical protein
MRFSPFAAYCTFSSKSYLSSAGRAMLVREVDIEFGDLQVAAGLGTLQ